MRFLENLDKLNSQRKKIQDLAYKKALEIMDPDQKVIIAIDSFHEGIIGIVAGRLTEKFNKPSVVLSVDEEK